MLLKDYKRNTIKEKICYRSIIKHDLKTKLKKKLHSLYSEHIIQQRVDEIISVEKTL